jgi:hypothetical protein
MATNQGVNERIKRRPSPEFNDTDLGMIEGIKEEGFLNVALGDANQYGPHAMIVLLGLVSTLTAIVLLIAMKIF